MRQKAACVFGLIGTLSCLPAAAEAQEESMPAIVVTGTRQARNIFELPGNDSVVDQARIAAEMPERPSELLNQLAGVGIEQGGGEEEIAAIRSPALSGGAGQGSVLLLEDGVPLRAAGFGNVNGLYEANPELSGSIELVRGPGSALYGSNAVHGLINFIPRAPSDVFSADVDGTIGSFGYAQAMGSVSDRFGDNAVRLSAEDHHESGWRDDSRMDEQKYVLRDVWQSGDDTLTATVSGQNLNQQTGAYITGKDAYLNYAVAKTNPIPTAYRQADSVRGMVRWQHAFSDSLQLSVTPYARYTEMNFMMFFLPSQAIQNNAHYSAGVQNMLYKSFAGGHSLIAGLDAEYTDGWYTEFQNKASFTQGGNLYPHGLHYDLNVASEVVAPYLHSEWRIFDDTRATLGVRMEQTFYDYVNQASTGIFGLYQRPASRSDEFTTVTPKFGLVQQWQSWLSSYLNLSRGARAPQVTDLYELQNKQVVGQVKSETLDSAEIGSHAVLDGVRVDLAAYAMHKNHYFYRAADGTNVPNGVTEHQGVELELSAPLPGGFDVATAATYAQHTYDFNRRDSTFINTVTAGSTIPNAPRSMANTRLGYRFAPESRAEVEWVHMGSYFTDNADSHFYGGHELFNLRVSAKLADGVFLHGKMMNMLDRRYADRAAITTTGIDQYFPGAPRSFLAGLAAHF
jgi:iron complex outermembrane receptor protein